MVDEKHYREQKVRTYERKPARETLLLGKKPTLHTKGVRDDPSTAGLMRADPDPHCHGVAPEVNRVSLEFPSG